MPVAPPARTAFNRATALHRLAEGPVDVLVVGGGITGAGVALDAASRGLRTALVEQADLASGTSSRSSKLVHGGLRYLQQRQFHLVHEALTERQRLLRNAPHLVHPLAFLIPLLGRPGGAARARGRTVSAGLWVYDLAGGVRIGHRHHRVNRSAALGHVPTLRADRLLAAWRYHDAHTDDARLTLAIARTAALDHGAMVVTHAPVTGFLTDARGNVRGAALHVEGEGDLEVGAGVVVNATGVWADHLEASHPGRPAIRPAKGIHLTVPAAALPCDLAVVFPVPGEERTIFAVPWGDQVYLGTTDTDYQGSLDQPRATAADISYLLDAVNAWVERPLSAADVTGVWAGLRPLLADDEGTQTADLSRDHRVTCSPSGLLTVTGGKLTTYRKMAADTVDQAVAILGRGRRRSATVSLRLRGTAGTAELVGPGAATALATDPARLAHLVGRYGGEARAVLAMVQARPELGEPLVPGLPYLAAEAVYAARYEAAHTLEDVLARRTRALLRDRRAAADAAQHVAALVAPELGWDDGEARRQAAAVLEEVATDGAAAGLSQPETAGR